MIQASIGLSVLHLALVLGIWLGTQSAFADEKAPIPYAKIGMDVLGDTIATGAMSSGVPVLLGAGVTYKIIDLAHDLGDAAIDRQDRWLGAELVLVDDDGKRLKELKAKGGGLDGEEAKKVKQRLRARMAEIASDHNSPAGYMGRVIIKNLPYAVVKVSIDQALEATFAYTFKEIGLSRWIERKVPVPASINRALNYGGPLEDVQKAWGWGKLGSRARAAEQAAEEAMRDQEKKIAAHELKTFAADGWEEATADALTSLYNKAMIEHPSQPVRVVAASFRLEAARAVQLIPAPVPVLLPAPAAAAVAAAPVDPVVRTIQTDDRVFRERYENPVSRETRTADSPTPAAPVQPQEDPRAAARRIELHEELMRVGDGKTFAVCSNGCPSRSDASWDGRRGQTLTHN